MRPRWLVVSSKGGPRSPGAPPARGADNSLLILVVGLTACLAVQFLRGVAERFSFIKSVASPRHIARMHHFVCVC